MKMDVTKGYPVSKGTGNERRYQRHGWKSINVGPDEKLYIAIGTPCDCCLSKNKYDGTISRMNLDGTNLEVYAKGVRNSVGFDWGRPVDFLQLPDGSLLVSDDYAEVIYRISYLKS